MCNTLLYSHLDYCATAWLPALLTCNKTRTQQLNRLLNRAARIITGRTLQDRVPTDTLLTEADNTDPSETNGRRGLRDFVRPYRGCILGTTAVVATLVIFGLVEISQLSGTLEALKRDVDGISRLSNTVDTLKRDVDGISRLSDTVDTLKRDVDGISRLSDTVDTLKRNIDGISRLSKTVNASKRDTDGLSRLSDTVDALKRDMDGISRLSDTVDTLKRDVDGISRLSKTVDALKRDTDGLSRLSNTVDALKRDMDGISRLSDTVDALRRNMDISAKMACLSEKATPVHYSGCKNPAILKGNSGGFTSPGYPNNYNNNARCSWTITVSSGRRAAIRFISLDLEQISGCKYDSVTVYDGSTSSGKQLGKFCGNKGRDVVASGRTVHIRFTSDLTRTRTGFSIKFSARSNVSAAILDDMLRYSSHISCAFIGREVFHFSALGTVSSGCPVVRRDTEPCTASCQYLLRLVLSNLTSCITLQRRCYVWHYRKDEWLLNINRANLTPTKCAYSQDVANISIQEKDVVRPRRYDLGPRVDSVTA
ncbi:hypothetical protein Bbelb_319960 [Branchiostoma belcheri]|nr:hypothetical protein Bbelb_319960 [Branchiostoma belcheri]